MAKTVAAALFLLLGGCASYTPPEGAEGNILSGHPIRPGAGLVQAVGVVPRARIGPSASAGGSTDRNAYRLLLLMENGASQTVDVDNPTFMTGEVVEVRTDGKVVRPEPSPITRIFQR